MKREAIWEEVKKNIKEVLPDLADVELTERDSLRELGADSIDRAEIIMLTLAGFKLKVPLIDFAQSKNIGEIMDVLLRNLQIQVRS